MKPPYLGLRAKHFFNKWTGEPPKESFMVELAKACKEGDKRVETVTVWQDQTGWAFTRYMWERNLMMSGTTPLRARRLAWLLDQIPPWPFEPTPSGWCKDGFPKEVY